MGTFVCKQMIDEFDKSVKAGDAFVLMKRGQALENGVNILIIDIPGNDRRELEYIEIKKNPYYSWVGEVQCKKLRASEVTKGEYALRRLVPEQEVDGTE